MKQKKLLPYAIGLLVILIILLIVGKKAGWIGKELSINVAVKPVTAKTITEIITANGKIQPETEVKISPDVSGEVIELNVKEGDPVKMGDLLLVIKPEVYVSTLNRMEASLNSSKARLAQSEAQLIERELSYKRAKQLFDKNTIPLSEFETSEAAYKVAQADVKAAQFSVKSAEASVAEAREQLTKTKIYAPITGTISKLGIEKGERVVGTNMYAGTETMMLADLNRMEVRVEVNENDIVKVSMNDTALVEVDAYLKRKFKGLVVEIANSAKVTGTQTDQVTNFEVKVLLLKDSYKDLIDSLNNKLYPFRPGMSATVDIQTETRNGVLAVPIQAVTTRLVNEKAEPEAIKNTSDESEVTKNVTKKDEEKQEIIFVYKDGRARKIPVITGIQDNNDIEILEGVKAGDEIITAPYNAINKTLKDSMMVKKVDEKELYKVKK
jgi:HlyD family secretion protein